MTAPTTPPKRGRPATGKAATAAERQARSLEALQRAGGMRIPLRLSKTEVGYLTEIQRETGITTHRDAIAEALRYYAYQQRKRVARRERADDE